VVPFEQRRTDGAKTASAFVKVGWRDVKTFDDDAMAAWQ